MDRNDRSVDLRSLGFYKINQEVLQEHLGKHYHFELADDVCNQYNRFVNLMRKEEENSEENTLGYKTLTKENT